MDLFRRESAWFLRLARQSLQELVEQHRSVPHEWIDALMAVADAWRAVDAADWRPCWLAGRILNLAGERELAWSYVTSPSLLQNGDVRLWLELARQQHWQGEFDFAERAFAVAASLQPNNAEISRQRTANRRCLAAMRVGARE
jgi:hypothetical protein